MFQVTTVPPKQDEDVSVPSRQSVSTEAALGKTKAVCGSVQHYKRIRGAAKKSNQEQNSRQQWATQFRTSPKRRMPVNLFDFMCACSNGEIGTEIRFNALLCAVIENRANIRARIFQVPPLRGLLRPRTFRDICRRIDHRGQGILRK
jgi:hypothetical protein